MGRPRKSIDLEQLRALAAIGCDLREMASVLKVSVKTLERRHFDALIAEGRHAGKTKLRRLQWQSAEKGHWPAQEFLGKQLLGQRERTEIELTRLPDEALEAEVQRRLLESPNKKDI